MNNNDNEDIWLEHVIKRSNWVMPPADLHERIMMRTYPLHMAGAAPSVARLMVFSMAAFILSFCLGLYHTHLYQHYTDMYAEASYYTDAGLDIMNTLGS